MSGVPQRDAAGLFVKSYLQTVSTGPRRSQHQHQHQHQHQYQHHDHYPRSSIEELKPKMNSADDIYKFNDNSHYRSPKLARQSSEVELPQAEKSSGKKEKKWLLGLLFRRRRKTSDSQSSSEEEDSPKKSFLQRRRQRKDEKRRKKLSKTVGTFDHIVVPPKSSGSLNDYRPSEVEVLSDPSAGFVGYTSRGVRLPLETSSYNESVDSLPRENINFPPSHVWQCDDGVLISEQGNAYFPHNDQWKRIYSEPRLRQEPAPFQPWEQGNAFYPAHKQWRHIESDHRLQPQYANLNDNRREQLISSLDSQGRRDRPKVTAEGKKLKDASSSDGGGSANSSLVRYRNGDNSYRLPKDCVASKKTRTARTERYVKRLSREEESILNREAELTRMRNALCPEIATTTTTAEIHSQQKPTESPRAKSKRRPIRLSPHQLHPRETTPVSSTSQNSLNRLNQIEDSLRYSPNKPPINDFHPSPPEPSKKHDVIKPIPMQRNPIYINQSAPKSPPPPPPRNPARRVFQNYSTDNSRPMSYAFEHGAKHHTLPDPSIPISPVPLQRHHVNRTSSLEWSNAWNPRSHSPLNPRPASATPDCPKQHRYSFHYPKFTDQAGQYHYFADQNPRSRKPIHIASTPAECQQVQQRNPIKAASEFWRQKDREFLQSNGISPKTRGSAPVVANKEEAKPTRNVNNSRLSAQSDSFSSLSGRSLSLSPMQKAEKGSRESVNSGDSQTKPQPVTILPSVPENAKTSGIKIDKSDSASSLEGFGEAKKHRKSTNLEEALNELEAIYQSLGLGDEDLLERAERRDISAASQKRLEKIMDPQHEYNISRGALSDSSCSYDVVDGLRRKAFSKRGIPDKVEDDMAYRRLNKEKTGAKDPQELVSQVSYMLASPVFGCSAEDYDYEKDSEEPDVTLDDMVYRNIKHTNNTLKVLDPQPPFGIPLGPIAPAPNSDYLHATPEDRPRSRFRPQKIPDIVKDDLAYRSLRKDHLKDSTLPPPVSEDYVNNNAYMQDASTSKKKRAARSLSANLYRLQRNEFEHMMSDFERNASMADIADAMEIAYKILKERASKGFVISPRKPHAPSADNSDAVNGNDRDAAHDGEALKDSGEELKKEHLDELLTALVDEARETSEKLSNDIKLLEEQVTPATLTEDAASSRRTILSEKLSDIDSVSEHAKLCEKLLECVVESAELIANKHVRTSSVEEEKTGLEELTNDLETKPSVKSFANIVLSRNSESPKSPDVDFVKADSDKESENVMDESSKLSNQATSKSPFEESKKDLISGFQELKKDLLSDEAKSDNDDDDDDDDSFSKLQQSCSEGEECNEPECRPLTANTFAVEKSALKPKLSSNCADFGFIVDHSLTKLTSDPRAGDRIDVACDLISLEHNSDSEISSGFHTESNHSSGFSSLAGDERPPVRVVELDKLSDLSEVEIELSSSVPLDESRFSKLVEKLSNGSAHTTQNKVKKLVDFYSKTSDESPKCQPKSPNKPPAKSQNNAAIDNAHSVTCNKLEIDLYTISEESKPFSDSLPNASLEEPDHVEEVDCETRSIDSGDARCNDPDLQPSSGKDIIAIADVQIRSNISNESNAANPPDGRSDPDDVDDVDSSVAPKGPELARSDPAQNLGRVSGPSSPDSSSRLQSPSKRGTVAWYRDPTNIMLACSYGAACAHQLFTLDPVTLLGLVLAVLSVVLALFF